MDKYHLLIDIKLSKIALGSKAVEPPCDLWLAKGDLPSGIEIEEPHFISFSDATTGEIVTSERFKMFDLSYDEFGLARRDAILISQNLLLNSQAVPMVLGIAEFASFCGLDLCLYEACDY